MKKILIFTHSAGGHHPEYVHHLYMGIAAHPELEAVIAVPEYFQQKKTMLEWQECPRIAFDLIPDEKVSWGDGKWYKRNFRFAKLVRFYAKKHRVQEIFMIDPMMCMPYLAFMTPAGVKVSGIIYGIYLYSWTDLSLPRKVAELVWHWLLAKMPCFKNIFVLNDADSAEHFNKVYHTHRFRYLPDPFMPLPEVQEDFRAKYHVSKERKIYFHFGSFGVKKGTLEILKSILAMPEEQQKKSCFVFAGCIQPVIKKQFDELYEQIQKSQAQCLVFDEFCSYEFLAGWCKACDAILVPYLMAYNSSGCIGYAAQFHKPVIGSDYGLLGKLIRKYDLGIRLPAVTPASLIASYRDVLNFSSDGEVYLNNNQIEHFQSAIFGNAENA